MDQSLFLTPFCLCLRRIPGLVIGIPSAFVGSWPFWRFLFYLNPFVPCSKWKILQRFGLIWDFNGSNEALTHWENVLGRAASSDVVINFPSVSRNHGTLVRDAEGNWTYNDLDSVAQKSTGVEVTGPTPVKIGDTLSLGGVNFMLLPVTVKEKRSNVKRRFRLGRPFLPGLL